MSSLHSSSTAVFITSTVFILTVSFLSESIASSNSCSNITGVYYNRTTNSCNECTNCTAIGLSLLTSCSPSSDSLCACPSGYYYDNRTLSCRRCTDCVGDHRYQPVAQCTASSDSICLPCQENYYYSDQLERCTIDCTRCPNGQCDVIRHDQCQCLSCQTGPFCRGQDPSCSPTTPSEPPTTPPTLETTANTQSFSPVSSALVAVGAVLGIIVFSTCFVLLGVVNSCRKPQTPPSPPSDSSATAITSASLASLYMNRHSPSPLQEYRTSLDILKYSSNSLYSNNSGGWSNRGSPLSSRSNSAPLV